MEHYFPQILTKNYQILLKLLWWGLLASLFFPIRYVFLSPEALSTGAYSDFTSFSLYLSDIFLLGLLIWRKPALNKEYLLIFAVFLGSTLLNFLVKSSYLSLNTYFLFKVAELFGLFVLAKNLVSKVNLQTVTQAFIYFVGAQSLLALWQFFQQKSLGLYLLGESHLSPATYGVAKIVSHGTKYIRSYGTFPHSNLLSAFLLTAILLNIYLLTINRSRKQQILYYIILTLNILGLFLTFSRAALLALIIGLILFAGYGLILKLPTYRRLLLSLVLTLIIGFACIVALKDFVATRATFTDSATEERVFYNKIGWEIVKDQPITGVGLGSSVLHMKQYSQKKFQTELQPWEIQPIHNYYLLTVAETGLVGLILILVIFGKTFISLAAKLWQQRSQNRGDWFDVTLLTIVSCYFILMLFDHYFYTIQQTQFLLWLILGLIAGRTTLPLPSGQANNK